MPKKCRKVNASIKFEDCVYEVICISHILAKNTNYCSERRENNDYYKMINRTESADSFLRLTKAHLYTFID